MIPPSCAGTQCTTPPMESLKLTSSLFLLATGGIGQGPVDDVEGLSGAARHHSAD